MAQGRRGGIGYDTTGDSVVVVCIALLVRDDGRFDPQRPTLTLVQHFQTWASFELPPSFASTNTMDAFRTLTGGVRFQKKYALDFDTQVSSSAHQTST